MLVQINGTLVKTHGEYKNESFAKKNAIIKTGTTKKGDDTFADVQFTQKNLEKLEKEIKVGDTVQIDCRLSAKEITTKANKKMWITSLSAMSVYIKQQEANNQIDSIDVDNDLPFS